MQHIYMGFSFWIMHKTCLIVQCTSDKDIAGVWGALPSKFTLRRYFRSSVPLVGFMASQRPGLPWQSSLCMSLKQKTAILHVNSFHSSEIGTRILFYEMLLHSTPRWSICVCFSCCCCRVPGEPNNEPKNKSPLYKFNFAVEKIDGGMRAMYY